MDIHPYSGNIRSNISMIKPDQILLDSTNTQKSSVVDNGSIRAYHRRRRRHAPLTSATIRRNKKAHQRKNQLAVKRLDNNKIAIDGELLKDIENFHDKQFKIHQRALYNARQTPLIPLITDIYFSLIIESSQQQNDLLMNILTLVNNVNEECSFFEQFKI